ncbi:MAG TPA: tRNA pseudouridine(55) synthase TruB, partial [Planctomycetota bacterium]|nr:tRNA pseudouridine(55) synthase TruB [Planctomycetota bacterium]
GTLDPMATGVLVLAIGEATKLVPYLMTSDKRYEAEVTLGSETDTLDARGTETRRAAVPEDLTESSVACALASFGAGYEQEAPVVSALKKDGRSLHARVRAGETVEAPVRHVEIHSLALRSFDGQRIRLDVHSGKGFYVRSLARDLASRLGTVGHLSALRRTASGPFAVDACVDGEALREAANAAERRESVHRALLSLEEATRFMPTLTLGEQGTADAFHGRPLMPSSFEAAGEPPRAGVSVRMLDPAGRLVAIGALSDDGRARVVRGFRGGE